MNPGPVVLILFLSVVLSFKISDSLSSLLELILSSSFGMTKSLLNLNPNLYKCGISLG
jgi:hypothetical protein